ncbi:MAG TPA: hypothetical protein VN756_03545 [Solirubrobacterales bacterium]|nr:hypothetical protein [Solirubrobacterales bacterium]
MATEEARAIWHPLRARILQLIIREPATLSQIIATTGEEPGIVAYHSSVLCSAGCIQAVEPPPDPTDPLFEANR